MEDRIRRPIRDAVVELHRQPASELAGYFQLSLRDKREWRPQCRETGKDLCGHSVGTSFGLSGGRQRT